MLGPISGKQRHQQNGRSPARKKVAWTHRFGLAGVASGLLVLGAGALTPSPAAEQIVVRIGPLQQVVRVADLERFAKTGEVPTSLKPFSSFLSGEVRTALNQRLDLDPLLGDKILSGIKGSEADRRLRRLLDLVVPGLEPEQLQVAIALAARQADGLSALDLIKSYPEDTLTVDVSAAIAAVSEFNVPYWQSQALSALLKEELTVKETPIASQLDPAAPGPQSVQQRTLTLQDTERDRAIPVDLYWAEETQGPLVVMSHGLGSDKTFLAYLAQHLASHGFTVAALEHPGSNAAAINGASLGRLLQGQVEGLMAPEEFLERPRDVSFLLDQLEAVNRQPGALQNKINTNQVTVIGHSFGGYTALALAGAKLDLAALRQTCAETRGTLGQDLSGLLQCIAARLPDGEYDLQDDRVQQAIALNPSVGQIFGKTGLSRVTTPTLILTSTDDAFTPALTQQLRPFQALPEPKYLLVAVGATHLSVGDPANAALQTPLFAKEQRGPEMEALRQSVRGLSLAFVQQQTPQANRYEPFLTPAYAQSLSTAEVSLRLGTELSATLTEWLDLASVGDRL